MQADSKKLVKNAFSPFSCLQIFYKTVLYSPESRLFSNNNASGPQGLILIFCLRKYYLLSFFSCIVIPISSQTYLFAIIRKMDWFSFPGQLWLSLHVRDKQQCHRADSRAWFEPNWEVASYLHRQGQCAQQNRQREYHRKKESLIPGNKNRRRPGYVRESVKSHSQGCCSPQKFPEDF